jgi:hypothetical protein
VDNIVAGRLGHFYFLRHRVNQMGREPGFQARLRVWHSPNVLLNVQNEENCGFRWFRILPVLSDSSRPMMTR